MTPATRGDLIDAAQPSAISKAIATCLSLTSAISRSTTHDDIYAAALDALQSGVGIDRASILLFDTDGVMRFKAWRGLSESYRRAVEGHTPWQPDAVDPQPIWVPDVAADASLTSYAPVFRSEGIAALGFIPLVSLNRVIGKFMLYRAAPTVADPAAMDLARIIASQVAFALERTRSEEQARRSEERLRFALDAASMGTWDWDLRSNAVEWSENLARIHGLPQGSFDGTFASYEREIHPEDRAKVFASVQRALAEGVPHDVEYRLVAPDGTVRWCEGKGRVEYEGTTPVRMSGVCVIVTRRKEAELAKLAAAEESARQKDEFLATLSHELRTPLNAIVGWTHILQRGGLTEERTAHAIDVIARNARLQAQLIDDILDVSRIITGKLEIEREPIAIAQLIESAITGITPFADSKRLTVSQQVSPDLPPIEGDPRRLHQVLGNVLTNAVKFTPNGGAIELRCEASGDHVTIAVKDSGIGIAPEFLPFVFDRFRQADSQTTRQHGGLGLGLAIARYLVEQHGGTMRVESAGAGQGTTFSIELPIRIGKMPASPAREADDAVVRLDGMTILALDDQADSREMVAQVLADRGARVMQCDTAEGALDLLARQPVDAVIADIAMPMIDGYEFMRRLRAGGSSVPAVAVTAFARIDDRDRALQSGYSAFVAKPIDTTMLMLAVRDCARR